MPGGLTVVAAIVLISMIMSTKEGRAEARERLKPFARKLLIPVALLWTFLVLALISGAQR